MSLYSTAVIRGKCGQLTEAEFFTLQTVSQETQLRSDRKAELVGRTQTLLNIGRNSIELQSTAVPVRLSSHFQQHEFSTILISVGKN